MTFGGTATHGAEYTTPATLTIAAGESSATGTLTVVDDSGREGNERILYRVNAEGHIGDTCQVTLGDDDPDGTPAPSIGRLTPISGGVGVSVTITGSNFGAAKGTSTVSFNGTGAATTSWSATSITAAVPVGAATGRVLVTVGGQASNGLVFAVSPTPVIGGIDPTSGEPGTSVVITGSNFGAAKRFSTVTFNGAEAVTTAWSATSIAATVPAGARTGNVVVTVGGRASNGVPFTVTGVTVDPTELTVEEGGTGTYTVVLDSSPASAVTVSMFASEGTDLSVDILPVFTASNWDEPQTVTVTAGEDEDREEAVQDTDLVDEVESITHTLTRATTGSSSSLRGGLLRDGYLATAMGSPAPTREYVYLGGRLAAISQGGAVGEVSVVVTIDDDDDPDTPGVPALTNSLRLTEGHTGAYTLELGAAPTANVAIALSVSRGSDNTADVTVNPARVTFTASNWDSPQWITVSVGRDDDTVGETEVITHAATSTDSRYQGIEIPDVSVVIRDRNPTRMPKGTLTASPNPCTIAAGQTTCSTTLSWTSTDTTAVQVRRIRPQEGSTSSINEIVVRSGSPDGNRVFTGIDLTDSPFYLYEYITSTRRRGRQLATVTVKGVKALSLSPDSGPVGTVVTIMGSAFGDSRGTGPNASTVTFNGTPVTTYTSWSDTRIVVEVPAEATTGEVVVTVGGTARTIGTFTVGTVPPVGTVRCTITAAPNPCIIAKGRSTCTSTLTWTSMNTTAVRVWTKRQERTPFGYLGGTLTAFTTTDSTSGNQNATIEPAPRFRHEFAVHDHSGGRRGSQLCSVLVTGDRALSLSPASGQVGTSVTVMGSRFGARQGISTLTFGGAAVTPTSWSDTRIVFTVPQNATTGNKSVVVTVAREARTIGTFTVTTMALPRIDSFTSDPEHIATNSHSTLAWQTSNAEQVTINGSSVPVDGAQDVRPSTTGSHTYTLMACASNCSTDTGNKKVTKTVTVTVWARPTISSCSANPTDVRTGGTSRLTWTATNAQTVIVTGTSGSVTSPHTVRLSTKGAHTFTLTASNPAWTGNYAASCTVTVTAWDEPTAAISANRTSINQGQPVTVTWSSTNAETTVITGISGIGTVSGNSSGSRDLTPVQGSHDYTITASNPAWSDAGDSETVTVDARPPGTISASPNPCTIAASATTCTTTVRWSATGTTGLLVRTSHNGQAERVHASSGRTGSSSPSWIQQSPAHSYVFYLYDYENRILGARLDSVTVTGQPAPPAPSISGILPSQGVPDSQVTISGSNFGTTEDTVSFGGSSAEIESWSNTSIDALVPRHLGRGTVSVTVTANGLTSTGVDFTVTGDPVRRDPEEECEDPKDCPEEDEEEEESTPDP